MRSAQRYLMLGACLLTFTLSAYARSNVVIKLVIVNPSKETAQTATLQSYLPKEVKAGDIVSKGDLQAIYDVQQGSYYIYGLVELKPSEVWEQAIELKDVWTIQDEEISSLQAEAAKYIKLLKDTDFAERINFICANVDKKLGQIIEAQRLEPTNPEERIFIYRDNLKLLESAKSDLESARGLLTQARPFSAGAIWNMILGIVGFLGVLGLTFYFAWYRQVTTAVPTSDFATVHPKEAAISGPVERTSAVSKKETKDIDQVLGE